MSRTIVDILKDVRIDQIERPGPATVAPDTALTEVYRHLDERRPGAVLVVDEGRIVGIFTERDVLHRTAVEGLDPATPVREVMSGRPVTLAPDALVAEAIQVMFEGGYRHVPLVAADGGSAGLVTSRDILRFISEHFPEALLNLPPRLHQTMSTAEGG